MAEVNHFYAEDTTLRTYTGSTSPQTPAGSVSGIDKILGSSLSANTKYLIIAKAVFGGNSVGGTFYVRLVTGDDSSIQTKSLGLIEPTYTTSGEGVSYLFVQSFSTDASPADVYWQFQTGDSGDTVWIDQYSLLLIDLDDLGSGNYVEASVAGTDQGEISTSIFGTDDVSIPYTSLSPSTEYLVLGHARHQPGSTGVNYHVELSSTAVAGTGSYTYHSAEGEDTNEYRVVGVMARMQTIGSLIGGGIQISSYEDAANGNWHGWGAYLIAIDVSAFADFDYSFAASGATINDTSAAYETLTPTSRTTAAHLFLGRINYTTGGNEARLAISVTTGASFATATEVLPGDDPFLSPTGTYQTQAWDPTDGETANVMGVQDYASGNVYLSASRHASDSNPTGEYEFLAVLNLELAAAGETHQLTGTAPIANMAEGVLSRTGYRALTAIASSANQASAVLGIKMGLAATASVASSASGELSVAAKTPLDGIAQVANTASAELVVTKHLAAVSEAANTASATLRATMGLSSTAPVANTASATVNRKIGLTGTAQTASSASGDLSRTGYRALDGTGQVANTASAELRATMGLAGTASSANTASAELDVIGKINLDGSADTANSASGAIRLDVGLSGTAASANTASAEITVKGKIALDGVASAATSASAVLTRTGYRALTGTGSAASSASATVVVTRPLDAVAGSASSASGSLAVRSALASTASSANTASAILGVRAGLSSSANAASSASGVLDVRKHLAGSAPTASSAIGSLRADLALSATAPVANTATGDLGVSGAIALTGTAPIANTASGSLRVDLNLAGTAQAASSASAEIAVIGKVQLTGTAQISSFAGAELGRKRGIAATSPNASSASGAIRADLSLTGVAANASSATGNLSTTGFIPVEGVASAASSASGELTVRKYMAGSAATASSSVAYITRIRILGGEGSTAASASGVLTRTANLSGVAAVAAWAEAILSLTGFIDLDAVAGVASDATGALYVSPAVTTVGRTRGYGDEERDYVTGERTYRPRVPV